jgi:hypothetical protein
MTAGCGCNRRGWGRGAGRAGAATGQHAGSSKKEALAHIRTIRDKYKALEIDRDPGAPHVRLTGDDDEVITALVRMHAHADKIIGPGIAYHYVAPDDTGSANGWGFRTVRSVLDREHGLLKAAFELGSPYVRSKYRLVEEIEKRAGAVEVVGLFPTIVVGGGADGMPKSHFANLMYQVKPYFRLACSLSAEGRLHHVHARDIARVARHLLDADTADGGRGSRIVLGNPAVTIDQLIAGLRSYLGYRFLPRVRLRDGLAEFFIRTFRIQLSPWDRYCMQHRDMSHRDPTSPATFGLPVHAPDIGAQLAAIGISP